MTIEEDLVRSIAHGFERVFAKSQVEHFARSGNSLIRLHFVDRSLADRLTASFLDAEPGPHDLQIGFLAGVDADLSSLVPQPPSKPRVVTNTRCFAMWQPGECPVLYLLDRKSARALVWLPTGTMPDWLGSRPALPIMYALSLNTTWLALHGAAVGRAGRMLLLAGKGRTGKTTAALSCARNGWDYAGDDFIYIDTASGEIAPLYSSARLRADMTSAFPEFIDESTAISDSEGELRYELRLGGRLALNQISGGSVAAIFLMRRQGAVLPTFHPARRFDAISAFNSSVLLTQPDLMASKFVATAGLAPLFFVDTGQNPAAIPAAFAEFIDRL